MCYFVVRLAGGPTEYEGRIQLYHNGKWHRVCYNRWNLNDAQVVCNELGYGKAITVGRAAFYGRTYGLGIRIDNLKCIGTEWTIRNCLHKGWIAHNCRYYEAVSVKCGRG